jgi:hypothetical protein
MPPEMATNQKVGSSNLSGRTIFSITLPRRFLLETHVLKL